jgi:hypothetical protein
MAIDAGKAAEPDPQSSDAGSIFLLCETIFWNTLLNDVWPEMSVAADFLVMYLF